MLWLIFTCVGQVVLLPLLMCLIKKDFSVESVIESTLHNGGLLFALVPYVALIQDRNNFLVVGFIFVTVSYFLLAVIIGRFWMINWRYFILMFCVVFFVAFLLTKSSMGALYQGLVLFVVAIVFSKIFAILTGLKHRYGYYFKRYVQHSFIRLQKLYSKTIEQQSLSKQQQQILWAIMIVENANNPRLYRWAEKAIHWWTKQPMTTGIMQVYSKAYLSDNKSIVKASAIIKSSLISRKQYTLKDIHNFGLVYNGDDDYGDVLHEVYSVITC